MTPLLDIFVPGVPQTKGSARAFVVRPRGGKARAVVINDNPNAKAWQAAISYTAQATGCRPVERGQAVVVEIEFRFARPKSHLGKRGLRPSAPARDNHAVRPDVDKCLRVVLDALSGIAYMDDAQASLRGVHKLWCDPGEQMGARVRASRRNHTA